MAALVQTIPQQTATVPILQSRPASSSSTFSSNNTPATSTSTSSSTSSSTATTTTTTQPPSATTMARKSHKNSSGSSGSYRSGQQGVTPTTTSQNNNSNNNRRQSWGPQLRPDQTRAVSDPQLTAQNNTQQQQQQQQSAAGPAIHISKDDSALFTQQRQNNAANNNNNTPLRPLSTVNIPSSSLMNITSPTVAKTSPDRYRRGNRRSEVPATTPTSNSSGSNNSTPTTTDNAAAGLTALPQSTQDDSYLPTGPPAQPRGHVRVSSADDSSRVERPQTELAKRYRRRSWGNMDNSGLINLQLHLPAASPTPTAGGHDYFDQTPHSQPQSQPHTPSSIHSQSSASSGRDDSPVRGPSKPEETKRTSKPSPLSQPVSADSESNPPTPRAAAHNDTSNNSNKDRPASPAASAATQRLAEVSANDARKPGKSRLRRAFSFGSASELIKASNGAQKKEALAVEKSRREMLNEELGPEQAAIAEQQEASGLGESIYSHYQGHLFNRSTDNLSVSSTASSASVMLRKMGRGVKRSSRSLVGMFRPKSTVGSPDENPQVDGSAPQVSMVNIEADRNSVSVNADPQDMPRGGTVFPKVEPNSAEASADQSRRSIIGGERERSEVLAAVRKGILKKTNSETTLSTSKLAPAPNSESPHSSSPSTPDDQTRAGKGVKIAGEDYFGSEVKPTPSPPMASKSLVFSPRIQLHDTWTSGEYDRRGEIATCNRLTPLLAQQIKEELNNFKMEMEVHETSKVYTHFL